jgi:uncharacterized protein YijF (DUF1287 family)
LAAVAALGGLGATAPGDVGLKLAAAARAQIGVTLGYDPRWTQISYPNGDVPRSTGVCADVLIRAARDALGIDLQKLVHEDMVKHFDAYPAHRVWGTKKPDANIDHRRVQNLETYFQRCGACIWHATSPTSGDGFPKPLATGDILSWLLDARLPHIGIVVSTAPDLPSRNSECRVVHNIGRGVEESVLQDFHSHRAVAHCRWPVGA